MCPGAAGLRVLWRLASEQQGGLRAVGDSGRTPCRQPLSPSSLPESPARDIGTYSLGPRDSAPASAIVTRWMRDKVLLLK